MSRGRELISRVVKNAIAAGSPVITEQRTSTAEARRASSTDTIAHSGVQPWSAGEIFPAVIARIERYVGPMPKDWSGWKDAERGHQIFFACPLADRLESTSWELTLDGRSEEYASREDAETVARAMLADPELRRQWRRHDEQAEVAFAIAVLERESYGDQVVERGLQQMQAVRDRVLSDFNKAELA